ncbi:MAG: wax ester/triacylglycerol synthase family O-acyltransferase [Roseiarcus sp.]
MPNALTALLRAPRHGNRGGARLRKPHMARSERMDSVDTAWLRLDRPNNPMMIVGLFMLAGPVDIDRLERTLAERLLAYGRFRQRVESGVTDRWWRDDPDFDIARHIKRVRLPAPGGRKELERFVADLAAERLDPRHPLWQYDIVEDYEGGVALIERFHHCIADGIALIGVTLSLTDERPDAPSKFHMPPAGLADDEGLGFPVRQIVDFASQTVGQGLRLSGQALRTYMGVLADPMRALGYLNDGRGIATELAYLLTMPTDSPTRFKGKPSGVKRVAWTDPIPLPELKAVGHALGCSINDILLASVAGSLHGYLKQHGDETTGVEVRALVPINLRAGKDEPELGNRFGILAVELPVGIEQPLERLYEVRRRMEELKRSYEPSVTLGLFAALGHGPKVVQDQLFDLLLSRASAVMTNVPGPQQPLYLGGSEIKQMMFWVPQAHDIGVGVSILSFNGRVQFGLMTDAAMVPDPQSIIALFRPEFEKLLYYVLMGPWEAAPAPADVEAARAATRPTRRQRRAPPAARRPKRLRAAT